MPGLERAPRDDACRAPEDSRVFAYAPPEDDGILRLPALRPAISQYTHPVTAPVTNRTSVILPSACNAASESRERPPRTRPAHGRAAVAAPVPTAYQRKARHPSTSPTTAISAGGATRIANTAVQKTVKSAIARSSG